MRDSDLNNWSLLHNDKSDIERLTEACKAFIEI